MSATEKQTEFKIGQHIVYPLQGVGIVKAIQERSFNGAPILYYNIYLKSSDMTVMVPVKKASEIGIRAIVKADDAMKAIEEINSKDDPAPPSDWKDRYRMNMELLKEGSIASFAKVVHSLYARSKVKELPVQERRLYENALVLLIDEASFATGKSPDEIKKMIFSKLEPDLPAKQQVVVPLQKALDDDDDADLESFREDAEAEEADDDRDDDEEI
ncbi:MAG: CarD family transcriptional regulator [Sphaerochaetaceae bacterium]|nr:CarD family transcriptional regulator [Spirochaetales bacterium]MDY5498640.1 CarD family transcriptional regulator [Sphaerochaetaceae bacterium]